MSSLSKATFRLDPSCGPCCTRAASSVHGRYLTLTGSFLMKQQNTEVPLHKINWFCIGYYAKIAAASTPICQVQDEIRVAHKMRQNCKLTFEWY